MSVAKLIPEKLTEVDELIHFIKSGDGDKLKPKLKEQWNRVQTCYNLLLQYKSVADIVALMVATFGYHESSAYRDVNITQEIYGQITNLNKGFLKLLAYESIIKSKKLAMAKGDARANAMCDKNLLKLLEMAEDISLAEMFSQMKGNTYNMVFIGEGGKNRVLDLSKLDELPLSEQSGIMSQIAEAMMPEDVEDILGT